MTDNTGKSPERIHLDADAKAGNGMFPRCFEDRKYVSKPPIEYVRADLVQDRIKELEAALRFYVCTCTVDNACGNCIQDLLGCGMVARQALKGDPI